MTPEDKGDAGVCQEVSIKEIILVERWRGESTAEILIGYFRYVDTLGDRRRASAVNKRQFKLSNIVYGERIDLQNAHAHRCCHPDLFFHLQVPHHFPRN